MSFPLLLIVYSKAQAVHWSIEQILLVLDLLDQECNGLQESLSVGYLTTEDVDDN